MDVFLRVVENVLMKTKSLVKLQITSTAVQAEWVGLLAKLATEGHFQNLESLTVSASVKARFLSDQTDAGVTEMTGRREGETHVNLMYVDA